jgi:hypothetical protein
MRNDLYNCVACHLYPSCALIVGGEPFLPMCAVGRFARTAQNTNDRTPTPYNNRGLIQLLSDIKQHIDTGCIIGNSDDLYKRLNDAVSAQQK